MKKVIVAVVVLGVLGAAAWVAYRYWLRPPERRACLKLATLCRSEETLVDPRDLGACEAGLRQLRATAGDESFTRATTCIDEAQSCGAAAACLARSGLDGLTEVLKGFFADVMPKLKEQGGKLFDKVKESLGDSKKIKAAGRKLLRGVGEAAQKGEQLLEEEPPPQK